MRLHSRAIPAAAAPRGRGPALCALLLLTGCGAAETAELVQEINDARGECTQERLKQGAEECVDMMQRYAEMGTEAMHTYVGAIRALDEALQRMPPVSFDTTGLGHALRVPLGERRTAADSLAGGLTPGRPSLYSGPRAAGYPPAGYDNWDEYPSRGRSAGPAPREWEGRDPRYDYDPRDRYAERRYPSDRRYPADPGYPVDRRYPADSGYLLDRGYPSDPRGGGRGSWGGAGDWRAGAPYEPAYRSNGYAEPRDGWESSGDRYARPPVTPPGVLLPPEQRLDRPWLREDSRYREPVGRERRTLPRDYYRDAPDAWVPPQRDDPNW